VVRKEKENAVFSLTLVKNIYPWQSTKHQNTLFPPTSYE